MHVWMSDPQSPSPLVEDAPDCAQASHLCTQCGLCCNGAIHNAAVLGEDEVEAAASVGLPVLARQKGPAFALPCPALDDAKCTIFGRRPRVCSRYACQLLVDYQDRQITFEQASLHVRYARGLLANVLKVLPPKMSVTDARLLVGSSELSTAKDLYELRLLMTALELYLDKHFRKPKEGKAVLMKEIESE